MSPPRNPLLPLVLASFSFKKKSGKPAEASPRGLAYQQQPSFLSPPEQAASGLSFESFQTRLKGDLRIGGKASYPGAALIVGNLLLEDDSELEGSIEVFGNIVMGPRARITQPLIVHGNLVLGPGATVRTCRVDGEVTLHRGALIEGSLDCDLLTLDEREADWSHTGPSPAPQDLQASVRPLVTGQW